MQERLDQNNGLASLGNSLTAYNKALSALRKQDMAYIDDKDMSDVEKEEARKGIDQQRKQLYDQFNRAFWDEEKRIKESKE